MFSLLILICCALIAPNTQTGDTINCDQNEQQLVIQEQNSICLPYTQASLVFIIGHLLNSGINNLPELFLSLPSSCHGINYRLVPSKIENGHIKFAIWLECPRELIRDPENSFWPLTDYDMHVIQSYGFRFSRLAKECTRKYNKDPKQRYRSTQNLKNYLFQTHRPYWFKG